MQAADDNRRWAVVFDVDGVLADISHAVHLIQREKPDWHAYRNLMPLCKPITGYVRLARMLYSGGYYVALLTNRSEELREVTEDWLSAVDVPHDRLIMRDPNAPYEGAKGRGITALQQDVNIMLCIDDDPRNIDMFAGMGLAAVYVHSGLYGDEFSRTSEAADVRH